MSLSFINDKDYNWTATEVNGIHGFFNGQIWLNDRCLTGEGALISISKMLEDAKDLPTLTNTLQSIRGDFGFCYLGQKWQVAMADRKRSFPVFYAKKGDEHCLSNSAMLLKNRLNLSETCPDGHLAFKMSGYCIGNKTLFKGLYQLQAGEALVTQGQNKPTTLRYYLINDQLKENHTEENWLRQLDDTLKDVFTRLVSELNGRQVIVPLSGGYDSRVILALLKKYGHDNIRTYTYGWPWLWEVKQAKQIADFVGVEWTFLQLKRKELLRLFHSQDRRDFFRFASGASATPGIPEYYSIRLMQNKGLLDADAVIINGQTGDFISGGHIPSFSINDEGKVTSNELTRQLIKKHFALWTNELEPGKEEISQHLLSQLDLEPDDLLPEQAAADLFERIEWAERQSKYIVNCVRAYEWLGYDWRLPLWDDAFMTFWDRVPLSFKKDQMLFKKYLSVYNPLDLFHLEQIDYTKTYPLKVVIAMKLVALKSRLFGTDRTRDAAHYLKYFMEYGPFFPQRSYREYLKDSKFHRNAVSYWSRYVLDEIE